MTTLEAAVTLHIIFAGAWVVLSLYCWVEIRRNNRIRKELLRLRREQRFVIKRQASDTRPFVKQ